MSEHAATQYSFGSNNTASEKAKQSALEIFYGDRNAFNTPVKNHVVKNTYV